MHFAFAHCQLLSGHPAARKPVAVAKAKKPTLT
jgi:hypothetical protein